MRAGLSTAYETVRIGGINTASVTRRELAQLMVDHVVAARASRTALPKLIFSTNGQGVSLAAHDVRFAAAMAQADLVHADGMSVVFASRLLTSTHLPERVATTDFFHDAARAAQEAGLRFFLLGGRPAQLLDACAAARRLYPQLQIAGHHHGYFPDSESPRICDMVRKSRADVLWVALGKPRQEFWALANRENLQGVAWIKTCGGLYAFLSGNVSRAPGWVQAVGLEWLYRLAQEPGRLAYRYLATNPHALWRMLTDSGPATSPSA